MNKYVNIISSYLNLRYKKVSKISEKIPSSCRVETKPILRADQSVAPTFTVLASSAGETNHDGLETLL